MCGPVTDAGQPKVWRDSDGLWNVTVVRHARCGDIDGYWQHDIAEGIVTWPQAMHFALEYAPRTT